MSANATLILVRSGLPRSMTNCAESSRASRKCRHVFQCGRRRGPGDHGAAGIPHRQRNGRSHGMSAAKTSSRPPEGEHSVWRHCWSMWPKMIDDGSACHAARNDGPEDRTLDDRICKMRKMPSATARPISLMIANTNRSVGTQVSGEIGYQYGEDGLPDGTIELRFTGQRGTELWHLPGPGSAFDSNWGSQRLCWKRDEWRRNRNQGNAGAEIHPHECIILGNTVMYGATGGALFANGSRWRALLCPKFRNGCGRGSWRPLLRIYDERHRGCLGGTGKNFGAGMTGGSPTSSISKTSSWPLQPQLITPSRLENEEDITELKGLIYKHLERTESRSPAKFSPIGRPIRRNSGK